MLRFAGIVADEQLQLLVEHATRIVGIGDELFGAVLQLAAESGLAARHRAGHRHCDILGEGRGRKRQRGEKDQTDQLQ